MDTLNLLQHYWWLLISLLGALLVFLLFVQGGQALLRTIAKNEEERNLLVNSLGRKWEFTFTTLVTFGGAFFASFPLFYSTSFGGGTFYIWMAILLVFVVQAVAYEYRRKPANVLGRRTFDLFLTINGLAGPLLLGTAVSTLYTGAPFTVDRFNLANPGAGGAAVISQWAAAGLEPAEALLWIGTNLLLGIAVVFLSMTLACQYFLNNIADSTLTGRASRQMKFSAAGFLVFFLSWFGLLLAADGWSEEPSGAIVAEPFKYAHNLLQMPAVAAVLAIGVVLLLWSFWRGGRGKRDAVWFGGAGTVLAVTALLLLAGWNRTAYYPSLSDMQSSLTIRNSSSSRFTLEVMSWVSLFIPFVAAYIWYAWRAINRTPVSREELRGGEHQY